VAKQTLVVALGITTTYEKVPLGLEQSSTENAVLCTTLLNGLIERGLKVSERILCVIDGGKGIRKALEDVFGDLAVIQRCTVHIAGRGPRFLRDGMFPPGQLPVSPVAWGQA